MPEQRVGLIGLGSMGRGIGKNLIKHGFPLAVYDANLAAVEPLQVLGADGVDSPRAVAERSDVVVTVLPNGPDVEAVALGTDGIASGARAGTIVMDCSTIDPAASVALHRALRERGIRMVDAGMGRSSKEADEGTLLFMVGAEPEDFEAVRPLLEATGSDVFHVGPPGHGITLKIVHNLLSLTMLAASAEAMVLAGKAGLDLRRTLEVLQASTTGHGHLRATIPNQALTGDYTPGFRTVLGQKDLRLGHNFAASLGVPLQTLAISGELFTATVAKGRGDWASGAIVTVLEEIVGIRLADLAAQQQQA
ncbi:MAG: NAD(P)-dependent oxidoreductase [Chloroflexota bacterium]|nr:NAD(P)-dependent oxidoreductase [Chloroflexota bacterium]